MPLPNPATSALDAIRRIPDLLREPFRREPASTPPRPFIAETIRRLAVLVIGGWVFLAIALNLLVPQLENVVSRHTGSFVPHNFVSSTALRQMGAVFRDSTTDNIAYVLLESSERLNEQDHTYYDQLIPKFRSAHAQVQSVMDLWSNPNLKVANESADGKAAYVMLRLAGNMGTTQAEQSLETVRNIVLENPPPPGRTVYVSGPGPVTSDGLASMDRDMLVLFSVSGLLIFLLLLLVYRSAITALVPLGSVGLALAVARPVVALLGEHEVIPVSMIAAALLSAMILGAGTDYSIFLLGRYHEARRKGCDYVDAYHDAYRGVAHVVLASGITIAGACACMGFTQLSVFQTEGVPCAIGILVGVAVSLTATPALIEAGRLLGFLDPKPNRIDRIWRKTGTLVARWPLPVLAASSAVLIVFILALPTARVGFNEKAGQPATNPSVLGYTAADRHFPKNRLSPDFIFITSDRDMRNPADLVALDQVSSKIAALPGVNMVQSLTRPLGKKLEQSSITYQAGYIGDRIGVSSELANGQFQAFDTLLGVLDQVSTTIAGLEQAMDSMAGNMGQIHNGTGQVKSASTHIQDGAQQVQNGMAALQGAAGVVSEKVVPVRELVDANPNCENEDLCRLVRTLLDGLDGVDGLGSGMQDLATGIHRIFDGIGPITSGSGAISNNLDSAATTVPILRATLVQVRTLTTTLASLVRITLPQIKDIVSYLHEIGHNVGDGNVGGFFLPNQAFADQRFQGALGLLASPDGKAVRMIVYGDGESFSPEGADRAEAAKAAAASALRGTRLEHAEVAVGGVGATMSDIRGAADRDFTLLIVTTLTFVFVIVLLLLRSLVAAVCVVGTVIFSYAAALGLAVLVWQHLLHMDLQWGSQEIAFVALVAVGSDYNLLLCSRIKEGMSAGLRTGMIRAFGGTGSVVTVAGIVFGITMFAMLTSDVVRIQQTGSIIGLGLILDTLIVRTFLLPSIASLLGRWFWWPLPVPDRPSRTR